MRVLIADPQHIAGADLASHLRADGHHVAVSSSVHDLSARVLDERIHLVVLDVDLLPGSPLLDLARTLRRESSALLLLIGHGNAATERVQVLEAGADVYLARPVTRDDALAQIHALLRRHPLSVVGRGPERLPVTTELAVDLASQQLVGPSRTVALSNQEFRLLVALVRHEGAVLSRETLLNAVWGFDTAVSDREVDVYIRYLRQKIEPEPARPRYLLTVWGRGYRYQGPTVIPKVLETSTKASAPEAQRSLEYLSTSPKLSQSAKARISREKMSVGHIGGTGLRR